MQTLAAPRSTPVFELQDDESLAAAFALRDALEAMRLAGEFDRPAFNFHRVDLTGD